MSNTSFLVPARLYDYLLEQSLREPPILAQLRKETAELPQAMMQIAPEQGQFMALLVQLMEARKTLDIGVFTGYSSLAVGLALPPGGRVIGCDINDDWASIAKRYWALAGLSDRIELRLGPAIASLDKLIAEGQAGSFDFAFIDADKTSYLNYYERCLALVRPGGLILVDNVFRNGQVVDPPDDDADTRAIHAFNQYVAADSRVSISMLPVADGLTLAFKRGR